MLRLSFFFYALKYDRGLLFGFAMIILFFLFAIVSMLSPYDPRVWNVVPSNLPPSLSYPFGTTSMGQDLFWIMSHAVRNSFLLGITTTLLSRVLAVVIATIAGYKGGTVDRVLMSINDGFVVMPVLPILILLSLILRENMSVPRLGALLALFGWAWDSRLMRSMILSLREREFTYTAVFSGLSTLRLVLEEYIPFLSPLILATGITNMVWAMGMEVTLSAFGLLSLELPTIGTVIQRAREYQALFLGLWWWFLTPIVTIVLLFVALYVLSTAIDRLSHPMARLRIMDSGKSFRDVNA